MQIWEKRTAKPSETKAGLKQAFLVFLRHVELEYPKKKTKQSIQKIVNVINNAAFSSLFLK